MKRILITGPESTGKSELARTLALLYKGQVIPEYAREYISSLGRPYQYRDVEHIALRQMEEYDSSASVQWTFFDTWLIITKVWFEVVYGCCPDWMEEGIRKARFDLVLLCNTDIPWIADPLRENGGSRQEELLNTYKKELDYYQLDWELVSGEGEDRLLKARQLIEKKLVYGTT